MKESKSKFIVLGILFIMPLVVYMFFASGVNNFAKLDTVSENVLNSTNYTSILKDSAVTFKNKITIINFMGSDVDIKKAFAFNLKEKIYDRFKDFKDLQFVSIVAPNQREVVEAFVEAINYTSETDKWFFIERDEKDIKHLFASLKTNLELDEKFSSNQVFIIDKNLNLRGRLKDDDGSIRYAYNMASVAELSKEMIDDVKIILAEYRLALKKYNRKNTTKQ